MVVFCCKTVRSTRGQKMAVRSTQCQNRAVRSTQGGGGCHPRISGRYTITALDAHNYLSKQIYSVE